MQITMNSRYYFFIFKSSFVLPIYQRNEISTKNARVIDRAMIDFILDFILDFDIHQCFAMVFNLNTASGAAVMITLRLLEFQTNGFPAHINHSTQ